MVKEKIMTCPICKGQAVKRTYSDSETPVVTIVCVASYRMIYAHNGDHLLLNLRRAKTHDPRQDAINRTNSRRPSAKPSKAKVFGKAE